MRLKVLTLRMNPATGAFDDRELVEFQAGKDVIEVSEHFLVHEKTPTLTLVVRYRDLPDADRQSPDALRKDWRAELDAEAKRIYDELRLWRGRKARREGMPPYLIPLNRELADLAVKRPSSIAQLREIEGIGDAKSDRWGEEILAVLATLSRDIAQGTAPALPHLLRFRPQAQDHLGRRLQGPGGAPRPVRRPGAAFRARRDLRFLRLPARQGIARRGREGAVLRQQVPLFLEAGRPEVLRCARTSLAIPAG